MYFTISICILTITFLHPQCVICYVQLTTCAATKLIQIFSFWGRDAVQYLNSGAETCSYSSGLLFSRVIIIQKLCFPPEGKPLGKDYTHPSCFAGDRFQDPYPYPRKTKLCE